MINCQSLVRRAFAKRVAVQPNAQGVKKYADFRSDTVTKPCDKMRDAMANAVVGDDVFGDDPTIKKLEDEVAKLLGKESSLFVSSGTQANLISMMIICPLKGESVIMGDLCHVAQYERGGIGSIAGIMPQILPNLSDATMDLKRIEYSIFPSEDPHIVKTRGLTLESSAQSFNGKCIKPDYFTQVKKICKKNKLTMHLDGARSWNAAVALDMEMSEMVKEFDLINVCMSKGMGCPVGSVIVGSEQDMFRAKTLRKMLGGGMRQAGHLAAAGLVSL